MDKPKKRFSAWNLLWIIPLALILALAVMMYVLPAFEKVSSTKVSGSEDWMKALPDSVPLSEVVLPGTHDSATNNVQLAYFSKCQALSIREQLDAGFRYLDIRLGYDTDLTLMHGFVNCTVSGWPWAYPLTLERVLKDCSSFLKDNPSETIAFCVKYEHGDDTEENFARMLNKYVLNNPGLWYEGEAIPTVGEARGKIVLLKRFDDGGLLPGLTFNWEEQKGFEDASKHTVANDNPAFTLYVQDRFEYDTDEKWSAFINGFEGSAASPEEVSLNFLSTKGHAKYGHPFKYATKLNGKLDGTCFKGWVIVDFGSAEIAEKIYSENFN